MSSRQCTVGVVGLGAMGLPMARALAAAGPVVTHDASPEARERARGAGLLVVDGLGELARSCNTVVLSLPDASIVSDVLEELCPAAPGLVLLDTSTVGPEDSRELARAALADGSTYLDTPVLGRPDNVGGWTIPMGGPVAAHAAVSRVLEPVAARVMHVGEVGAAATLKVANNLMFSVINAVTAEALLLVQAAGLDPGVFVDTVVDSGAATVSGLFRSIAPRAVDGDFDPIFSLELLRKDNDLAIALAASLGLSLEVGQAARDLHDRAVMAGHGGEDSIAVLRLLEREFGEEARRR
jgi:3-hydroxyisobutyrate dehydrogenase